MRRQLTAIITPDGDGFVALCPELDIASQADTIEVARENLREAVRLFLEVASPEELQRRQAGASEGDVPTAGALFP